MIKENELRVGNILNYITSENDIVTAIIDWQDLKWINEDPKGFNLVHGAIPITEEWLVKFGFEKDLDGSFVFGLISIFKDKRLKQNVYIYTESTQSLSDGQWVVINDLKLQQVHQLQNLYFALTGDELTIKTEL